MRNLIIILFSVIVFTACNQTKQKDKTIDLPASTTSEASAVSTIESATLGGSALPTSYVSENPAPVATATTTGAGRINPAHGEPGHLCEYEVGAWIAEEATPALPQEGRINPPHGEPGHLCEYEVGAVIPAHVNGALPQPVEAQSVISKPTPITPSMTSTLSRPINKVVPVGAKPQFNPQHGEPWHTCDLPVGAPLS